MRRRISIGCDGEALKLTRAEKRLHDEPLFWKEDFACDRGGGVVLLHFRRVAAPPAGGRGEEGEDRCGCGVRLLFWGGRRWHRRRRRRWRRWCWVHRRGAGASLRVLCAIPALVFAFSLRFGGAIRCAPPVLSSFPFPTRWERAGGPTAVGRSPTPTLAPSPTRCTPLSSWGEGSATRMGLTIGVAAKQRDQCGRQGGRGKNQMGWASG